MPKVEGELEQAGQPGSQTVPDGLQDPLRQELQPFPHQDALARSMGSWAPRGDRASTGPTAQNLAAGWGADGFATMGVAGFADPNPDLHTAAHEAAHLAQDQSGVHLYGGEGDAEDHADAVADAVVAGQDATPLLDGPLGYGSTSSARTVRFKKRKPGPRRRASGVPLLPNPTGPDHPDKDLAGRSLHVPTGDEGDGPVSDERKTAPGTTVTTTDHVVDDRLHRRVDTSKHERKGLGYGYTSSTTSTEHVERRRNGRRDGVGPDGQTPVFIAESQETTKTSSGGSVQVTEDGVKLAGSRSESVEHRHQSPEWLAWSRLPAEEKARTPEPPKAKSGTSTSGTVVIGSDSVTVGGSRTTTRDDLETTTSGSVDVTEGKFTGGRSVKRTDGDVERSRSVSGTVDLREDGQLEGLSGSVGGGHTRTTDKDKKHSHGGSFSLGGGYTATISKPAKALEEDRWTCTWKVTFSGSGSLGGSAGRGGTSAGVTAKLARVVGQSGTLVYDNEAAANAAYSAGVGITDLGFLSQRELKSGETRSRSTSTTAGVSGSVSGTVGGVPVTAGAGYSTTDSHGHTETGGDGFVDVQVFASEAMTVNASIAAILKFEYGYTETDTDKVTVRFDTTTPEGKRALAQFRDCGALPTSGYDLVKKTLERKTETTTGLTVLGQGLGSSHSMESTTTRDPSGRVTEVSDTGTSGGSLTAGPLGHHKSETSLTATKSVDTGETYSVRSEVDSTYATDANKALARATNTYVDTDMPTFGGPKASGTWSVESTLSQSTIDQFLDKVERGGFRGGFLHGDLQELGARLPGKSRRSQRRLVAAFVQEKGDRAADAIARIGGQSPDFHVQLKDDLYLQGLARHDKTARRIRYWRSKLRSTREPDLLLAAIRREGSYHKKRRAHLQNDANYPELPRQQRETEIRRSEEFIKQLDSLVLLAKEAQRRVQREERERVTEDPIMEQCIAPDPETPAPVESAADKAERARLERWQRNSRENRALAAKKARVIKWHKRLQTGSWAMRSAKSDLAYSAFFGLAKGPERGSYAEAEKAEKDGDRIREQAESKYIDATSADGVSSIPLHEGAYWKFSESIARYSAGITIYTRIKAKYQSSHPGAFEGYRTRRQPG